MIDEALYEDEAHALSEDGQTDYGYARNDDPEASYAEEAYAGHDQPEQADAQPHASVLDPLEQLPVELTLRCGELQLTLGDLRRLGPGSVLEVNGISPGHATLCHGERVVAEGELVDVDGRLGLQITRVAPRP